MESLSELVFAKPLNLPVVLSEAEKELFGGFVRRFEKVQTQEGSVFWADKKTGDGVWESPEVILAILLLNKKVPLTLKPRIWFGIAGTPLLVVRCKDGTLLLLNKVNGRAKVGAERELASMSEKPVAMEIWGIDRQDQPLITIEEVFKQLKTNSESLQGQNSHGENNSKSEVENQALELQSIPDSSHEPTEVQKKAFFDVLRENNYPVLGGNSKLLRQLTQNSRDPRVTSISSQLWETLASEFSEREKKALEAKANSQRESLKTDFEAMVAQWQRQQQANPKLKANFSLFKEKFKFDKRFKEANKYFDLEKTFKESLTNLTNGSLPTQMKGKIDQFIEAMRGVVLKTKAKPTPVILTAPEVRGFEGLSEMEKKRIYEEFRDRLE